MAFDFRFVYFIYFHGAQDSISYEHETNKERTNKTRQSDFSTVYICCWSIFAKSQCVYVPFLVQPHNIAIIKQSETMSDIKMAKIINKYKYKEFVVEYQLWMQALYTGGLGDREVWEKCCEYCLLSLSFSFATQKHLY